MMRLQVFFAVISTWTPAIPPWLQGGVRKTRSVVVVSPVLALARMVISAIAIR